MFFMIKKIIPIIFVLVFLVVLPCVSAAELIFHDTFNSLNRVKSNNGYFANNQYTFFKGGVKGNAVRMKNNYIYYTDVFNKDMSKGAVEIYFKPYDETAELIDIGGGYNIFLGARYVWFESCLGGCTQIISFNKVKLKRWNHLIVTWNVALNKVDIYLNGRRTTSYFWEKMSVNVKRGDGVVVGSGYYGSSSKLILDNLKIWDIYMNASKVKRLYQDFLKKKAR